MTTVADVCSRLRALLSRPEIIMVGFNEDVRDAIEMLQAQERVVQKATHACEMNRVGTSKGFDDAMLDLSTEVKCLQEKTG